MNLPRRLLPVAVVVAGLAVTSCSSGSADKAPPSAVSPTAAGQACTKESLQTRTPDHLTIAAQQPTYAPWFVGDDPSNGRGYEAALGYRIAQRLGYQPQEVTWVRDDFASIVGPGDKRFDIGLAEASILPARREHVDFSQPYAEVRQAVVTYAGSPVAGTTTRAQLRSAHLGAAQDTTSYAAIAGVIKATTPGTDFPSIIGAGEALTAHTVDGIVADVPTAFYLARGVLDDGEVLGTLPAPAEQIGAVLSKDSSLTPCMSSAIASLKADGTLGRLAEEWLSANEKAPELH